MLEEDGAVTVTATLTVLEEIRQTGKSPYRRPEPKPGRRSKTAEAFVPPA